MKNDSWFSVDKEGLKELQLGKPKHYVARELIQNAWDENTTVCKVEAMRDKNTVKLSVEDDNPGGFNNLADAFTLFSRTYKRKNPEKRGRFNLGEKQAFSICDSAMVETTKGTIVFDSDGRHEIKKQLAKGSKITVWFKATTHEFEELLREIKTYLTPEGIDFVVNNESVRSRKPFKNVEASLLTELEENGVMRKVFRKTNVLVYRKSGEKAKLYELGLPVQDIECDFDLNVQQKVPLGIDRETVPQSFLQDLYAEVLNNTFEEIDENNASALWVRTATSDSRIQKEAVATVLTKRFGEKFVSANPFDRNSIDEAISHGFKVIMGNEMSREEWSTIRNNELIKSSSDLFGMNVGNAELVKELTPSQLAFKKLAQKIAERCLKIGIRVNFIKLDGGIVAQYGHRILTVNLSSIPPSLFDNFKESLSLILHELGHEAGNHTESSYHELLTDMAAHLVEIAKNEPEFFKVS